MSPETLRFVESIFKECSTPYINQTTGKRTWETSRYKNISIEYLSQVREYFKMIDKKVRIRYRGSRINPADSRNRERRMQDCAKKFANRFSVYYV